MMTMTGRQKELLEYITSYVEKSGGVAPSFEEMKYAVNLKSKSGVHRLINALVERGLLRRIPNLARAIEIVPEHGIESFSTDELYAELARRAKTRSL